jgi:cytochrome c oxidase subunit IV
VGNRKRQKYSVIVQMFFTVGALVMTLFFYVIDNWRINWCFLVVAPSLLTLVLIFMYIEETPQFLMKQDLIKALEALNRIGKINLDRR